MPGTRAPGARLAASGVALAVVGIVAYFAAVVWLPSLPEIRNHGVPSWILVGVGAILGVAGVWRAFEAPAGARRRWLAPALATADLALVAAFAWLMYGMSAVAPVPGPAIGAPAPDFALAAGDGRHVGLADFRGRPVLLVFYRGHW